MNKRYYVLCKKDHNGIGYIDCERLEGFRIRPQNQVEYDGIMVNKMVIINPGFIDQVLKRKIKRKLNIFLNYIITVLEDDDADPAGLAEVLNDLQRYRSIVANHYRKFLDQKYFLLLQQKMELIEQELKNKLFYLTMNKVKENVEEETHRRSR